MSNINKAILKVAQENPEFRKALVAELRKQGGQYTLDEEGLANMARKILRGSGWDFHMPKFVIEDVTRIGNATDEFELTAEWQSRAQGSNHKLNWTLYLTMEGHGEVTSSIAVDSGSGSPRHQFGEHKTFTNMNQLVSWTTSQFGNNIPEWTDEIGYGEYVWK